MKERVSLSWTPERLEGGHEAGRVWLTVQSVESPLLGQTGLVFSDLQPEGAPPPRPPSACPIGKLSLTEHGGEGGQRWPFFLSVAEPGLPPSKSGTFLAGGEEQ